MSNEKQEDTGRKKAMIVGISEYKFLPNLKMCKKDGDEVYKVLTELKYEIKDNHKLIGKVTFDNLRRQINDFFGRNVRTNDTLLFYFSGHGLRNKQGDEHYFATSAIDRNMPADDGIDYDFLEKRMCDSKSQKILTILDCCYSGAAGKRVGKDSGDLDEEEATSGKTALESKFREGKGKCFLMSSSGQGKSWDMKDGPFSLFTNHLLQGLKGGNGNALNTDGYVTPATLGSYVYNCIANLPDERQTPIRKVSTSGDIFIAYHPDLLKQKTVALNEKLLTLLQIGKILEFNKIRKENEGTELNLSGKDLEVTNLSGTNLSKTQFFSSELNHANLLNSNLSRANLSGANLKFSLFVRTNLSNANLTKADCFRAFFSASNLSEAIFSHADLSHAVLSGANLSKAKLIHTYLIDTELTSVTADMADFSESLIIGCKKFFGLKCKNADFTDAIIDNSKLVEYLNSHGAKNVPVAITQKNVLLSLLQANITNKLLRAEEVMNSSILNLDNKTNRDVETHKKLVKENAA